MCPRPGWVGLARQLMCRRLRRIGLLSADAFEVPCPVLIVMFEARYPPEASYVTLRAISDFRHSKSSVLFRLGCSLAKKGLRLTPVV